MYEIEYTTQFRRSFKKCVKRGLDPDVFKQAIRFCSHLVSSLLNINHISYRENIQAFGNATFNLIGY